MSKVFRLYKEGAEDFKGWNESPTFPYNSAARATIDDPDGANSKKEITSIPSPFARIDLVKNAFKEVCNMASANLDNIDGTTIFHKMVSDTFDVGEIFFNIDKLKEKVEIITCNLEDEINVMDNDGNQSHHFLADALRKYLRADASTYNFDNLRNIYLLNYVNGPDELNIIGATSPATLFFCGANKLSYVNDIFFQNNDVPFDSEYQPLYKRDHEYVKMWWTLRKTIPNFSNLFPEIEEYINLTYRAIQNNQLKSQLQSISQANISDFSNIDVQENGAINQVEVLGYQLLKKKSGMLNKQSDFTIKSSKQIEGDLPLVLPIEAGNKYSNLEYVNGKWGNRHKAVVIDENDLNTRVLPFDGNKYPYLTISDFLEDTLVAVKNKLNKDCYFDGHINADKNDARSYLLPIKPLYFKYFTADDLMSTFSDGRCTFEMERVAGGSVVVYLRVPIIGNGRVKYIEYMRTYYVNREPCISEFSNEGEVKETDFTGFVMPGVKFTKAEDAYYTISYVSSFSDHATLQFYKDDNRVENVPVDCRNPKQGIFSRTADTYTLKHVLFDYIRVKQQNGNQGILLPTFKEYRGLNSYEFSVDLGTSNTHMEMKKSTDAVSIPFSYEESENVMSKFFLPLYKVIDEKKRKVSLLMEEDIINADMIPSSIGNDGDFTFPTRTALSYAKITDWTKSQRVLGLLNFTMTHDKKRSYDYNGPAMLNIKWGKDVNSKAAMKYYVENLLLLIRNKVVAKDGSLASTKIVWFYPNSMSHHRLSQLKSAWDDAFVDMFGNKGSITSISESVAPIQYFRKMFAEVTNLVNVDIGGGTTDIAFSDSGKVNYITSFKFGANSLFQDSFSDINPNNGIIDSFKDGILDLLEKNSAELAAVFNNNVDHPADMASFLFSLKDNEATQNLNSDVIDFNRILQNDDMFKIVFLFFYTAIIYHVAQIVKVKGLKVPRHIAFSGNGSKILNVITNDNEVLAKYTKLVFEVVLSRRYDSPLEILGLDGKNNPKEATCKGGLVPSENADEPQTILLKNSNGDMVNSSDKYSSIDELYKNDVVGSVKELLKTMFDVIPKYFNLDDMFGISKKSLQIAQNVCKNDFDLFTYLEKGIIMSNAESGDPDNIIEETLSFYPIKGVMQTISTEIFKTKQA